MPVKSQSSVEQVALRLLLDNAYEEFSHTLQSVGARFVLWGSFSSAKELQQHYFLAKGKKHILDARRSKSLSQEDADLKDLVEGFAGEAEQYAAWVRKHSGQPILGEMLISYCTAFENCLKKVALVFALAEKKKLGLDDQVFVLGEEYKKTLKFVQDQWKPAKGTGQGTAEVFFESQILNRGAIASQFKLIPMDASEWVTCRSAFQVRNALVHQLGIPTELIEIGDESHYPASPMQLTRKEIWAVRQAFLALLRGFDPSTRLLDLL